MGMSSFLIASLNIFCLLGTKHILTAWFLGILVLQMPLFAASILVYFIPFFKYI